MENSLSDLSPLKSHLEGKPQSLVRCLREKPNFLMKEKQLLRENHRISLRPSPILCFRRTILSISSIKTLDGPFSF